MTGKELLANLLQIIPEADLEQEIYLKDGSEYSPIDSIKLDIDKGILLVIGLEYRCEHCGKMISIDKQCYCEYSF